MFDVENNTRSVPDSGQGDIDSAIVSMIGASTSDRWVLLTQYPFR